MSETFQCGCCGARYVDQQKDGTLYFHACGPLPPDNKGVSAPRKNARNENIALRSDGRAAGIVAEGAGVKCLTRARLTEQDWLTKLRAEIKKREDQENA
jgi:hypothetical protein